jgi:hypothetical protein
MIWTVEYRIIPSPVVKKQESGVSCQFGHRISNTILNATKYYQDQVPYQSSRKGPGPSVDWRRKQYIVKCLYTRDLESIVRWSP